MNDDTRKAIEDEVFTGCGGSAIVAMVRAVDLIFEARQLAADAQAKLAEFNRRDVAEYRAQYTDTQLAEERKQREAAQRRCRQMESELAAKDPHKQCRAWRAQDREREDFQRDRNVMLIKRLAFLEERAAFAVAKLDEKNSVAHREAITGQQLCRAYSHQRRAMMAEALDPVELRKGFAEALLYQRQRNATLIRRLKGGG